MWVATQARSGDSSYNQPFTLCLDGPLDLDALRRAFDALVRRHPPLRSRVAETADGPHMVPDRWPAPGWEVEEVDDAAAGDVAATFGRAPVDLDAGPLMRTRLLRTGPTRHRLLVNQHHIASDERSVEVFTDELVAAYADCVAGREPSWPGAPPDYPDYWRRRIEHDEQRRDAAALGWREHLSGAPELADLPTVQPRPVPGDPRRAHHDQRLEPDLARRLDRLARAHRASTYMVFKAALDVVLGGYGPGDVLTGVALYGRDTAHSADLMGFLARPAVLRGDLSGDPTFVELVGRTRGEVLDAHERPELPLDEVLDALGHTRDPSHHPLYQVMFSAGRPARPREVAGLTVRLELPPLDTMKVDLDVGVTESDDGLDVVFSYRADLFAASTVAAMARHFRAVLRAVAADPYQRVAALRRQPAPARPAPVPYAGGPLARVRRAVEAAQDAVAVRAGALRWTYARLWSSVEHVAATLHGLRPEARVGVCAAPTPELVAALLAVPLAGGVTVPVDPARPTHRLRDQIAELRLDVVLVDRRTETLLAGVDTPLLAIDRAVESAPGHAPAVLPVGAADRAVWVASAGEPGAVVLTNRNLDSVLAVAAPGESDGTLARPLDSVGAMWSVLATVCGGGCLDLDDTGTPSAWPGWAGAEVGGPAPAGPLDAPRVLDAALRPVPSGGVGHLYVGGAAVARGYLDRPGRTAATFVADPFGPPGARMVATGDLVRRYPGGGLHRVGRVSECVRRLGVLISPTPAETALSARPGVARAGVVVTEDGRLLAGVQAEHDLADRLRDDLAATLPASLVPDRVVAVDMVPLLRSGAIDRTRLLAAVSGPAEPGLMRPVTPVEREVARAWRAVLGRPAETGRTFFEMGGDSVHLIRLRGLLVAALGCELDVVELFRHPTARAMAAHLQTLRHAAPDRPARATAGAARGAARQRARRRRVSERE
jgi:non-ribosomal peptide synthetase component F